VLITRVHSLVATISQMNKRGCVEVNFHHTARCFQCVSVEMESRVEGHVKHGGLGAELGIRGLWNCIPVSLYFVF
jgi:hypothetical protein